MRMTLRSFGLSMLTLAAACGDPDVAPPEPGFENVDEALAQFNANPRAFMDALPKKDSAAAVPVFARSEIESKAYIEAKNKLRADAPADAPGANDQARNLVDSLVVTKLADMGSQGLKSAYLAESPWSDDYWGLYAGSIAKRYTDPKFPTGDDWKANTDYVRSTPPANADDLSPAEKYDLLVGDSMMNMTKFNLDTGKPYYMSYGKVETWMGICHGWAPAAFMVQRPQKTVEATAADGRTKIKFYPSDMKALSSLLWANTNPRTRFIGGRCNVKDPAKDTIGRIKDTGCRDTNAGTWHLAIVNQIGKAKRSMVLDATYDYEVWNQPVYGYSYSYFNPKTNRSTSALGDARVAVADFPEDKFKAYRAAGTTHIVGIAMDVKWVVETYPSHNTTDSASRDAISGARYLYTLELDAAGNIVGGEWLQNAHPDFLWTPPAGTEATATGEYNATGTWDGKTALPTSWQTTAKTASQSGQPLWKIVKQLVTVSRQ